MKLVRLDFGAEKRPIERFMPRGKGEFYEVDCPFCDTNQLVQTRKFRQGIRCRNPDCRAMLYYPMHNATRDMLPANETVLVHGLRTSIAQAQKEGAAQ